MALEKVSAYSQLEQLLQEKTRIYVLKNSTTCPISHEAFRQFEKFSNERPNDTLVYLNVQEARPLSNEIAEKYSIKHESPQVLLFDNNRVIWHASHWKITVKELLNTVEL